MPLLLYVTSLTPTKGSCLTKWWLYCHRILKLATHLFTRVEDLQLSKVCPRWVLRLLSDAHKQHCFTATQSFLQFFKNSHWWQKWIHHSIPKSKHQSMVRQKKRRKVPHQKSDWVNRKDDGHSFLGLPWNIADRLSAMWNNNKSNMLSRLCHTDQNSGGIFLMQSFVSSWQCPTTSCSCNRWPHQLPMGDFLASSLLSRPYSKRLPSVSGAQTSSRWSALCQWQRRVKGGGTGFIIWWQIGMKLE